MQPSIVAPPRARAEESVLGSLMGIGRFMRQRVAGDRVDQGTYALLKGLHCSGPMRVTELAAMANLDTSTVSRHVQQLHRAGLVERSADPADGRAQQVGLTPHGLSLLEESIRRRQAVLRQTLQHWDDDDVLALDRLLAQLAGDLEQITAEPELRA